MSKTHKGRKGIMYEICNEPNGVNWATIKTYAEKVIPAIRANDPESIIICGTPNWSLDAASPAANPLTGTNAYNVMYTYHLYAASYMADLPKFKVACGKIPLFVTEFGLSQNTGTGTINLIGGQEWVDAFNGLNDGKVKVSWTNWSFSDKDETSAVLKSGSCNSNSWTNTTNSGTQIRKWTSATDNFIKCTTTSVDDEKLENQVICAPNPFNNQFNIQCNGKFNYFIYDLLGNNIEFGEAENEISTGKSLNAGSYFIKIQSQSGEKFLKIIKI